MNGEKNLVKLNKVVEKMLKLYKRTISIVDKNRRKSSHEKYILEPMDTCKTDRRSSCGCNSISGDEKELIDACVMLPHIFCSIQYKDSVRLDEILNKYSFDLNELNEDGITALHFSAITDSADCAQVLLKHGACVNLTDIRGQKPIHYAEIMENCNTYTLLAQYS